MYDYNIKSYLRIKYVPAFMEAIRRHNYHLVEKLGDVIVFFAASNKDIDDNWIYGGQCICPLTGERYKMYYKRKVELINPN